MFTNREDTMMVWGRRNGSAFSRNGDARSVQARLRSIRGDIGALQEDVAGLLSDVSDAAGNRVTRTARDAADRVENWGTENLRDVRKTIQEQPLKACALAAGAGALVSLFLLRR
jgi:ElaB/YqjD/DUF883 family membrane-anchored ribosome-binding protein